MTEYDNAPTIDYTPTRTLAMFHADNSLVRAVKGPYGCLSAASEVLTPIGWVPIGQWDNQPVMVCGPDGSSARFEQPEAYVNEPCDKMYRFSNSHSLHMEVSPEHRMPLYDWSGKLVTKTAEQVYQNPSRHTVPTHVHIKEPGVYLSDAALRVWAMIAADGCYPQRGNQCLVAVRKERKVVRVRELLQAAGVEFSESVYAPRLTEVVFRFQRPDHPKHFDQRLYGVNSRQAALLVEEILQWDGCLTDGQKQFTTTHAGDAALMQFFCHASGCAARYKLDGYTSHVDHHAPVYHLRVAHIGSPKNNTQLRVDTTSIEVFKPSDGRKYCFTTSTGYFLCRSNGRIFVTGNSGKSVGMVMEILMRAMAQKPNARGVRKVRWLVVRNTYAELKSTTIQTFMDWLGPLGTITYDSPIRYHAVIPLEDKTTVDLQVWFLPLDRPDDVKKLKSLEITAAWLNEASELEGDVLSVVIGRLGRYPSKRDGGPSWVGVILDTNPPATRHWFYDLFELNKPKQYRIFHQPPALLYDEATETYSPNPDAENIGNLELGYSYYMNQTLSGDHNAIRVRVMGQYGEVHSGRPIYARYVDHVHCSPHELQPMPGVPVIIGIDFGLNPAAVFTQMSSTGAVVALDEIAPEDISTEDFFAKLVIPKLITRFRGCPVEAVGDPSGVQRSALSMKSAIDVARERGLVVRPAPTNDFVYRKDAVDFFLSRSGGFAVDPSCAMLRQGFLGGYRYKKARGGADAKDADKNVFSHIHDALQYACIRHMLAATKPAAGPPRVTTVGNDGRPLPKRAYRFA